MTQKKAGTWIVSFGDFQFSASLELIKFPSEDFFQPLKRRLRITIHVQ